VIKPKEDIFLELKKAVSAEKKIVGEIVSLLHQTSHSKEGDADAVLSQISSLKQKLSEENKKIPGIVGRFNLIRKLQTRVKTGEVQEEERKRGYFEKIKEEMEMAKEFKIPRMERGVLKRLEKKKAEAAKKKEKKPSVYAGLASRLFSDTSRNLVISKSFGTMVKDLLKTNLGFVPSAYISIILLSVSLSFLVSIFLLIFLLFFNVSLTFPFITPATDVMQRFLSRFWIIFVVPIITFFSLYLYPTLEKRSLEAGIDQELPFATINMSAIAGSK